MSSTICHSEVRTGRTSLLTPEYEPLIADVAAGDEGAMARVWSAYAAPIRSLARSLSGATAADADDVVQEVLAKVWRGAAKFEPTRGSEATFVFTIARRVIIDRWRRACSRPVETSFDDRFPLADHRALDVFDQVVLSDVIRNTLTLLSAPQREVIEMAYQRGLGQSEIAAELEIPLGTVKTRTLSALRNLHRILTDRDGLN